MKFCTACGHPVREGTQFCVGCGGPVHNPAPAQPAGTEPAGTEPASVEPASVEPASTEPAGTEPASVEPADADASTTASPYVSAWPGHTEAVPPLYQRPASETISSYGYGDAGFSDVGSQNVRVGLGDGGSGTWGAQPGGSSPAGQSTGGRFPGPGKRIMVMAAVVVGLLAAGGGAFVWAASRHTRAVAALRHGATASAHPTSRISSPSVSASSGSPSVSPSPGSPSVGTASPNSTSQVLQVAPGVAGNATAPQVEALVTSYFAAINAHNYQNYVTLLTPSVAQGLTPAQFNSGYGSSSDSNMMLTGISSTGSGSVAATLTFTSRQLPADSPNHSSCDNWQITLYLQPDGNSYLIGPTPAGYQASPTACQ